MITVRTAEPADVPQMVALVRSQFPSRLLGMTILGCHGFADYLDRQLRAPSDGAAFFVADGPGGLAGLAQWRWAGTTVFLNHLFVTPRMQSRGIGTRLVRTGLDAMVARHRRPDPPWGLDVFDDNARALRWYRKLGLAPRAVRHWLVMRPERSLPALQQTWFVAGWPQAERAHRAYGFSEFRLESPARAYRIGRLGDRFFRTTDARLMADPVALAALAAVDPGRELLLLADADQLPDRGPLPARTVATSRRLQGPARVALEHLAASPAA